MDRYVMPGISPSRIINAAAAIEPAMKAFGLLLSQSSGLPFRCFFTTAEVAEIGAEQQRGEAL